MLSYNEELKALSYMLIDGNIIIRWIKTGNDQVIKPSKDIKNSPIIYFDWLYSMRGTLDFIVAETVGIRFYRYD